jgi:hypothetical protein
MSTIAPLTLLSAVVPMNASAPGWTLSEGDGPRSFATQVTFERSFSAPPIVQVSLTGVDSSKDHNLRVRLSAVDVTALGFTLVVETWFQSQVWAVDASWLAIGL